VAVIVDGGCAFPWSVSSRGPSVSRGGKLIGGGDRWLRPAVIIVRRWLCTGTVVAWIHQLKLFKLAHVYEENAGETQGVFQSSGNADVRRCLALVFETMSYFCSMPTKDGALRWTFGKCRRQTGSDVGLNVSDNAN